MDSFFSDFKGAIKEMVYGKSKLMTHSQMLHNKAMRWTIRDFGFVWKNYEKDDTDALKNTLKIIAGQFGTQTVEIKLNENLRAVGYR